MDQVKNRNDQSAIPRSHVAETKRKIPVSVTRERILSEFTKDAGAGLGAIERTARRLGVPVATVEIVIARELDARARAVSILRGYAEAAIQESRETVREVWAA